MKSDQELIEAINKGQSEAFEVLYYRYRDWVFNLAWRFTGNKDDALDVLQETFAYLLNKFPDFKLTAAMTTFLYPVVKHISLNIKKKNQKFSSENDISEEVIESKIDSQESIPKDLSVVLSILPGELKEILLMKYIDEMSQKEISQALDMPLGTVKSSLHRALQVLRENNKTRSYFLD